MPLPDRPVDDAEIATDWGQEIHDRVLAPKGCRVHGGTVNAPNTHAIVQVPIDTADDDPGGWLDAANDRIEVPTGAEGLYTYSAAWRTDDLDDADELRCYLRKNGSDFSRTTEGGENTSEVDLTKSGHVVLAAGDQITSYAKKIGASGAAVDVWLVELSMIRIGAEYGA